MSMDDNWSSLPPEILIQILERLCFCDYYFRLIAVCKSWRDSVGMYDPPCLLPPRHPFLLLAEEVAPGAIVSDGEYDSDDDDEEEQDSGDENQEEDDDDDDDDDDTTEEEEEHSGLIEELQNYDHSKKSVGSSRGLYSLLTGNTYIIDLPEAAGRLIIGTNIGWLVTLGTDLQINLLHPLLRHQISLPPMRAFPQRQVYNENYQPEDASEVFIEKIAISSKRLNKNAAVGSYHHHATPSPIVMALYRGIGALGFARLGDRVWTDVNIPSCAFHDIVYHNGKFYVVDCHGGIFVCGVDDDKDGGGIRGTKIAKLETKDWDQKYLVESSSGSGLLVLVRECKVQYFDQANPALRSRHKYRTTGFSVWRLDLKSCDSIENISCSLIEENYLENEAIFIGRNSSVSISSSDFIKPNSIYFTDDNMIAFLRAGGGHDMGIFDVKSGTIEPHYPGKSIHPISPPLWYI